MEVNDAQTLSKRSLLGIRNVKIRAELTREFLAEGMSFYRARSILRQRTT